MKKMLYAILAFTIALFGFQWVREATIDSSYIVRKPMWAKGEQLTYRLHYGIITAGRAVIEVDPQLYKIGDNVCEKINVDGRTVGAFDLVAGIHDTWRCYLDTHLLAPRKSFRNIEEGGYRLKEEVYYDYKDKVAKVTRSMKEGKESTVYPIKAQVQDIVSGFYFLRRVNYQMLRIGDTIPINAFFDKESYDFRVRYLGRGNVDTDIGKCKAVILSPILPANKVFSGEHAIKAWISDDLNHIPLKVEVSLLVGAAKMEITDAKNLKHPFNIIP